MIKVIIKYVRIREFLVVEKEKTVKLFGITVFRKRFKNRYLKLNKH